MIEVCKACQGGTEEKLPAQTGVCVHERWLLGRGSGGTKSLKVSQSWPDIVYNSKENEGNVTKRKFMCLGHSEAKQTEMLEFGAEKGLLQGQGGRTSGSC